MRLYNELITFFIKHQMNNKNNRSHIIGVIGGGQCSTDIAYQAEEVGKEIARKGGILICGGLGGDGIILSDLNDVNMFRNYFITARCPFIGMYRTGQTQR